MKECSKCNEKIRPSLPWILNRIQKVIKYVTKKRKQKNYVWPNDSSYVRLFAATKKRATKKRIGKLEKVDAAVVAEDRPGVQIQLEVKPDRRRKRFFDRAKTVRVRQPRIVRYPTLQFPKPLPQPLAQVLRGAKSEGKLSWNLKRGVHKAKAVDFSVKVIYLRPNPQVVHSWLFLSVVSPLTFFVTSKLESYLQPIFPYEILNIQSSKNFSVIFASEASLKKQEGKVKNQELSAIVLNYLKETKEDTEQMEKVKELEIEVKGLKDLMTEVHKNQVELSKVLLEKKVFSHPMVKLTDPKMLEEESKIVKKATEMEIPRKSSSLENLQVTVDELKRKCSVKNRMIVTLLKGLQSNVPKEWWEELLEYIFDDKKPLEEFDTDKVTEFIRQTSLFLLSGEKVTSLPPGSQQSDGLSREEADRQRGNIGAEFERTLKNLLYCDDLAVEKSVVEETRDEKTSGTMRIFAFPANSDTNTEIAIRKLENQVCLLNVENNKLWHQVEELRQLLKTSVLEMNTRNSSLEQSSSSETKTSGKTINLTIQIADKDGRRLKNMKKLKVPKIGERESEEMINVPLEDKKGQNLLVPFSTDQKFSLKLLEEASSKSERRHSENDLNFLDESLPSRRSRLYTKETVDHFRKFMGPELLPRQEILVPTPHPSSHEVCDDGSAVSWVPSKYTIPEMCEAGPSRRGVDVAVLLQKPSVMELAEGQMTGMFATMANERELQTIPENEHAEGTSSGSGVSQAIQKMRTRVRSVHKDMVVMKTKNDRIDKLLDRIVDDAAENMESFEKLEKDVKKFKNRLG